MQIYLILCEFIRFNSSSFSFFSISTYANPPISTAKYPADLFMTPLSCFRVTQTLYGIFASTDGDDVFIFTFLYSFGFRSFILDSMYKVSASV